MAENKTTSRSQLHSRRKRHETRGSSFDSSAREMKNGKGMDGRVPSRFLIFSKRVARISGRPGTFLFALGMIVVWGITGPLFHFSDTWQLFINTGTSVITFLMVFLIQNTQNRDTEALQIKLDELIRSFSEARNTVLDLEELDENELETLRSDYLRLARQSRERLKRTSRSPKPDRDAPDS